MTTSHGKMFSGYFVTREATYKPDMHDLLMHWYQAGQTVCLIKPSANACKSGVCVSIADNS